MTDEEIIQEAINSELVYRAFDESAAVFCSFIESHPLNEHLVAFARAILARFGGHHAPVPVSERLPGPEDCLDEGWAWFFSPRVGWRQAVLPVSPAFTHWLPAHALPLPAEEVQ
jgi:hypothetical protein